MDIQIVGHGIDYYKYFTLLLQEMSLDVEENFLMRLLDFFKFEVAGYKYDEGYGMIRELNAHTGRSLWDGKAKVEEPVLIDDGNRMYFEVMQFQPIKVNITFARSETTTFDEDT